ncbi:MAG: 4-hydroxybenzoate octaprenyltransferase [Parvularculaceae bacterium]
MSNETDAALADAAAGNWVDRWAPAAWRPYLRLARMDRPIGAWLLLLPCWQSAAMAAGYAGDALPNLRHLALFALGAVVMRGAGCAYNDIVDRNIDASVARTAKRPVASGQISVRSAWIFVIVLSLIGLIILLQFNLFTIFVGAAALALVAAYPFMKRITYWPQAWLGLTFNWGALMGWSAAFGSLSPAAVALYAGGFFWTLGYDTIYAHQDKEDDALAGVKSAALKLGARTKPWLWAFYSAAMVCYFAAAYFAEFGPAAYVFLAGAGWHFVWQIRNLKIDDPESCLHIFRSNRDLGLIVFASFVAASILEGR